MPLSFRGKTTLSINISAPIPILTHAYTLYLSHAEIYPRRPGRGSSRVQMTGWLRRDTESLLPSRRNMER